MVLILKDGLGLNDNRNKVQNRKDVTMKIHCNESYHYICGTAAIVFVFPLKCAYRVMAMPEVNTKDSRMTHVTEKNYISPPRENNHGNTFSVLYVVSSGM